ncbi:MAG: arylsulfatase [Bryobacteraceae bacterium]
MTSRRDFLAASLWPALSSAPPPQQPNVILIMTDDQGYGDLACHGNPAIRTPAIDKLHGESVRLTNYHVSPTCAPTRSALLTGRYTNSTGAWHTIMGRSLLHPREVTIADCFRASGYRTGIFGKWHLGDNHPCRPQDRGFDEVLVHGGGGVWQTPDYFGNDYADDTYFHNGRPEKYSGFCTDVWFANATKFIDGARASGKAFFCYIPTNAPHGPMWSPESKAAHYARTKGLREPGFYGMIENIDDNVGRFTQWLERTGLAQNTILIFTTDNGTSSGGNVFNAGMRGVKGSPYEGGHRVPFFIRWPERKLGGGRDIGTLTAHIDVTPTLIDLCGLKRPKGPEMHGRSLRSFLENADATWPDRAVVTDSQRLDNIVKWRQTAVMTDRWRLVNPSPDGNPAKLELYDIRKDPGQQTNVATAEPAAVAKLSAEYDRWWQDVSVHAGEPVRISLGHPAANPVRLTCHDWHGEGSNVTWNQHGIRLAPVANGYWAVDVVRAGRYRIELRRWPQEVDLPINAPYKDPAPNRESAPGKAIRAVKARLSIAGVEQAKDVAATDKAAVFDVELPKGPAELHTWLIEDNGAERGAYFAYVERR